MTAAAALIAWIVIDVAAGGGTWTAVGRYVSGLLGRAGPTRDLWRRVRRAAGGREDRRITLRVWPESGDMI